MKCRIVLAALGIVAIQMLCVAPAVADDEPILVSDPTKLELTVDKTEGTTSVTVINPSPKSLRLKTMPIDDPQVECEVTPSTTEVVAHTQKAIKVTFTGCSDAVTSSGKFTIAKDGAPPGKYLFEPVSASQKAEPDVPWKHMVWFLYCGAGGFVVLLAAYLVWLFTAKKPEEGDPNDQKRIWPSPCVPLPGLDSSWTFKESWASNATVIAAAFTGVLGATDVANTIFGEESAEPVLAISAVATAVALGLAGTAPMLLQMLRRSSNDSEVTPLGIIAAGIVTIAGTGGELGVLVSAAKNTDVAKTWVLDVWDRVPVVGDKVSVLTSALVLGLVLLALYAFFATQQNFRAGVSEPAEPKPATVEVIIKNWNDWIAHWKAKVAYDLLDDAAKAAAEEPGPPAEPTALPAFAPAPSRRRTAIL